MTDCSSVLAFDTSTSVGGVAVRRGARVVERSLGAPRTFSDALVPAIESACAEAGCRLRGGLDAVVVGAGPGSFTGVRIAAATAKGLGHALELPLFAYSSLAAAAYGVGWPDDADRCVVFDARADRVYWAVFPPRPGAPALVPPRAGALSDVLAWSTAAPTSAVVAAGDGARKHAAILIESGFELAASGVGMPSPVGLLTLFDADPEGGRITDPARWQPDYLKAWTGSERAPR